MPLDKQINPQIKKIHPYIPGKTIEEVAQQNRLKPAQVLKLASNENVLGPSPKAVAAVKESCKRLHLYPDGSGKALKIKIAQQLKVKPNQVLLGNGSNELLEFVCKAFVRPGDEVVVPEITFSMYNAFATLAGAKIKKVSLTDYVLDTNKLLKAVNKKTKIVFLCNPNNPTGTVISHESIKKLIRALPEKVIVVLDEAYGDFRSGKGMAQSQEFLRRENVLLLRTFSKIFGLASLRIGYGLAHPKLADLLNRVRQPFNVNGVAQAAACAGFADKSHQSKSKQLVRAGKKVLEKKLKELNLLVLPSEANFVCVRVGNSKKVSEAMQKEGVVIRPLGSFGLKAFIRITIGTAAQNRRVIKSLKRALKK